MAYCFVHNNLCTLFSSAISHYSHSVPTHLLYLQGQEKSDSLYQQLQEKTVKVTELSTTIDKLEGDVGQLKRQLKDSDSRISGSSVEMKNVSRNINKYFMG